MQLAFQMFPGSDADNDVTPLILHTLGRTL